MDILKKVTDLFRDSRVLWDSTKGTAARMVDEKGNVSYAAYQRPAKKSGTRKPTEAEDNAEGRRIRRRTNRALRRWLPFAQR